MHSVANLLFYLALYPVLQSVTSCRSVQNRPIAINTEVNFDAPKPTQSAVNPGKYIGFLRLKSGEFKLPFSTDLIAVKSRSEQSLYKGLFRLDLGGFGGVEAHTQYFSEVNYDHKSKQFFFNKSDSKYQLKDVVLKAESAITGKMVVLGDKDSEDSQDIGDFILVYSGSRRKVDPAAVLAKIFPDRAIMPTIGGNYQGQCDGSAAQLQVSLARWPSAAPRVNENFFRDYRINAVLSQQDKVLCGPDKQCTKGLYSEAQFSLLSQEIAFSGRPKPRTCKIAKDGWQCDRCVLRKSKSEAEESWLSSVNKFLTVPKRAKPLDLSAGTTIGKSPDYPGAVEGEYFGYLFNEHTQRYQLMRLKVNAKFEKSEGMQKPALMMSGLSTLFYGGPNSSEFMVYRYNPGFFSDSSPYYVFDGPGESFLQISQWNEGAMRGVWYGKTMGRVGTVELSRARIPDLPKGAELVSSISGTYTAAQTRINLMAQSNLSVSERDFFSLSTKGIAVKRSDEQKKIMIQSASFDPYSDRVVFELMDGRLWFGKFAQRRLTILATDVLNYGSTFDIPKEEVYTYEKDPFQGTTAMQMYDMMRSINVTR